MWMTNQTKKRVPLGRLTIALSVVWILSLQSDRTAPVHAQEFAPRAGYETVAEHLAATLRWEMDDKQLPAVALAIVDERGAIWATALGNADWDQSRRATIDTLYRVGSVSKLFTDVAAVQMVEEGWLDLDEPIATYLPEFVEQRAELGSITLRQLMSHRSGLVRESPVGHYFDPHEPGLYDTVMSLTQTAFVYPPGERTKYSNAAIALVGLIVERMEQKEHPGATFEEIIRRRILMPLGMERSRFILDDASRPWAVEGAMWSYDGRSFVAPPFALGTLPAGNLYSSVADQSRFLGALIRGGEWEGTRILQPESLVEMYRQQYADGHAPERAFGLGFALSDWEGRSRVGHGGAVYGCATELAVLPDEKLGVVVVTSKDCANSVVRRLADQALRACLAAREGQPLPLYERSAEVGSQLARQLAGEYRRTDEKPDGEYAWLLARDEELVLDHGVSRGRVRRIGERLVVDDVLVFGKVLEAIDHETIRIDGVEYRRLPHQVPAPMPERFVGLVGEYGWDHNVLFIYERHGRLHALIEWFFDYPLTEIDAQTFAFPNYGLYHGERLLFDRDGHGNARAVVAAEVRFERRTGLAKDGVTFQIQPLQPIETLRAEALHATPPEEHRTFRQPDLVEVTSLDESIKLDIRYAGDNNFLGTPVYEQPRALLQRPAAEALARVHRRLREKGLGLLIYDAYRPWYVTHIFYEATPGGMKHFVANPQLGSRHNRGCAVDLTLYDLTSGEPVEMVSGYDEFTERAYPDYAGPSYRARWYRELLRTAMEAEGFRVYEFEWWHFDYQDWREYPILNVPFDSVASPGRKTP